MEELPRGRPALIASLLIGVLLALTIAWVAVAAFIIAFRPPGMGVGQTVRIVPDAVRLAAALFRDRSLPRSVRLRLSVALVYNFQPINLIPDFIPVIGFADNVAVLAWALRGAVKTAGAEAVAEHWPGSPQSLAVLCRALRLS